MKLVGNCARQSLSFSQAVNASSRLVFNVPVATTVQLKMIGNLIERETRVQTVNPDRISRLYYYFNYYY